MACIHGIFLGLHQANRSESRCMHMQKDAFQLPYVPTRAFTWKGHLMKDTIPIGSNLLVPSTSCLRWQPFIGSPLWICELRPEASAGRRVCQQVDLTALSIFRTGVNDQFLGGGSTTRMDKGSGSNRLRRCSLVAEARMLWLSSSTSKSTNAGHVRKPFCESSIRSRAQCTRQPAEAKSCQPSEALRFEQVFIHL